MEIEWTDKDILTEPEKKYIDRIAEKTKLPEWTLIMFDKKSRFAIMSNLNDAESIFYLEDILKAMLTELQTPYRGQCDA